MWTEQQKRAIDIRNTNTLVSAAAGSGKTAVLVERVLQLITSEQPPVPIDRMLIATFTNAAAAEMRERIYRELTQRLEEQPQNAALRSQLTLLGQAQITTVHAFCQHMIRDNFHHLGLSADFEVGDMVVLERLKGEAMEEVLDETYQQPSPLWDDLMDKFGGKRDDSRLIDMILQLFDFSQSTPNPAGWLDGVAERYRTHSGDEDAQLTDTWGRYLLDGARLQVSGLAALYDDMEQTAQFGVPEYLPLLQQERQQMLGLMKACGGSWNTMAAAASGVSFASLPRRGKQSDPAAAKAVQTLRNRVKTEVKALQSTFCCPAADIVEENNQLAQLVQALCQLVARFGERFAQKKRKHNIVDFNDLEHFMLALLTEEEIAQLLRQRFDYILVDEFQDTNGVQAAIFEGLARGDNLFMVGDVKQSIYGFRNAQPRHFLEKYRAYSREWSEAGTKILLSRNFRSSQGIIDFVNYVFERIMSDEVGDCTYSAEERLECGNGQLTPWQQPVELHLISSKYQQDTDLSEEELQLDAVSREAMFTAQRILQLVEVERPLVFDKALGRERPVEYRDVVVLSRSVAATSVIFAQQLALAGIPVYTEQTGSYFMTVEIGVITSFLRVIDNPLQDVPLLAVLRSPMFLFTDDELAQIRMEDKHAPYYQALAKSGHPKVKLFLEQLERYRFMARYQPLSVLIRTILSETGYLAFVGALPGGKERMDNLNLLCQRAALFEGAERKTLFQFLQYLDWMVKSGKEYTTAKTSGENDNAVTIMSMHKSKGLEFPVVFLVRCGAKFNMMDLAAPVLYDCDLGIGLDWIDLTRHLKYPSVPKLAIAQKKRAELLSEEMRILYVALTRAREKLVIVGSVPDGDAAVAQWQETEPRPAAVAGMRSFIQWIGAAVAHTGMIQTHSGEEVLHAAPAMQTQAEGEAAQAADDVRAEISTRLGYQYPYQQATITPAKCSVSELVEEGQREYHLHKISTGADRERLSPAARGTIVHFVLQNIKLNSVDTAEQVQAQVEDMVNRGMLLPQHREAVDVPALHGFFQSELGRRMRASVDVRREHRFFVDVPAREVLGQDAPEDETVLVQGVIDCCFLEDGQFVIIDYKTGSLRPEYQRQLELYALCLEKGTGRPVKETHVYPLI